MEGESWKDGSEKKVLYTVTSWEDKIIKGKKVKGWSPQTKIFHINSEITVASKTLHFKIVYDTVSPLIMPPRQFTLGCSVKYGLEVKSITKYASFALGLF
jgi:hypothetical protein